MFSLHLYGTLTQQTLTCSHKIMQKAKSTRHCLLLCFACLFLSLPASSQDTLLTSHHKHSKDTLDYYEMSLEELQKLKAVGVSSELEQLINSLIGVASIKPLTGRESPSIISLITEDEIKSSGARDL